MSRFLLQVQEVCIIPDGLECCLGQRMVLIKPNNKLTNNKFLLYALLSEYVQEQINKSNGTGSIVSNLRIPVLKELRIPHYNIRTQKQIAKVLSDLDAKIEVNNKINQELEAMARTLYDYWFVQFDFPDANGKPYKSSGGKMVFNEVLKREIPEEWEACLLGDVVAKTGTGLNPRKHFVLGEGENYYVTIKNINQGQIVLDDKCDKISDESLDIINNRSDLRVGDILYTSIEPVGTTYLLRSKPTNWNINESVFTIRPDFKKVSSEFLYMFLSGDYIKAYTKNVSAGSIHKGVRHGTLKDCKFILPNKITIDSFSNKMNPILDKLELIQKENQKLSELRDWLLPMLMNGQVTISNDELGITNAELRNDLGMVAEEAGNYKLRK
ncbi:restriction endonuclease subunit S [Arenibacter algicola]|uniref:restriction endonuclease subunit S n=1 Tax=Arenibacter algicola TaxID=616991 RepID=UPI000B2B4951|nr:restriction endonuclease subunit S [Arenibacter algicola]